MAPIHTFVRRLDRCASLRRQVIGIRCGMSRLRLVNASRAEASDDNAAKRQLRPYVAVTSLMTTW